MSDAKFLGLCIVFAAVLISGTIVWSTETKLAAVATAPATKDVTVPVATPAQVTTVRIDGPVTLAPLSAPLAVTVTNTDENPVVVKQKDAPDKVWHRNP